MTTIDKNTPAHDHQPSALCNVRKAGGMGSLLRSLAGTPAGWRPTRRGSFLVLVVGTLALLAVMAIIYSSIGNHDVRMKAAVAKHERLEDAPEQIKNYILSIIGDSVTATFYDTKRGLTNQPVLLSRVTFDFPYTDWTRRSDSGATLSPATAFNPTGSVTGFLGVPDFSVLDANQMPAKWIPSTPWLADSEPTYLNYLQTPIAPGDLDKIHQFRHDWGHLTNIAPDGRFINLYNLRGNWAAVSGIGAGETSDSVGYVYNVNGNQLTTTSDFGDATDVRFPAFMDSRQRWLFRPAGNTLGLKPNDVRYEPYLFADADGDGMYDSRWQELVDARQAVLKNYLNVDSRYRYVVATRIVDLSSMVNVNTATDGIAAPSAGAPVGMSPADVDLRGLLTGQASFLSTTLSTGVGLDAIPPTTQAANSPANYAAMDQVNSFIIGRDAYTSLRLSLASGVVPPADNTLYSGPALASNFEAQYGLAATDHDYSTEPVRRGDYYKNAGSALQSAVHIATGTAHTDFVGRFGMEDMLELVTRRGVNDPSVTSPLELTLAGRSDPVNPLGPGIPDQHSPLRSNRPLEFELARYTFPGLTVPTAPGSPYDRTMVLFNADSRQRLTTESGGRQFRQAPSYYTSSGDASINAYQLGTNELRIDPKPALKAILAVDQAGFPRDVPNLVTAYQGQQANRHAQTNKIFQAYVSALAPRLGFDSPGAWAQNDFQGGPRATEFYGYSGPEVAIRIAAHLTANLIDAFDSKNTPTVHTLLLDGSFATTIDGYGPATPEAIAFSPWRDTAAGTPARGLQLPVEQLGDVNNGVAPKAPAINIFGVEAQPFITQVASFTVYADKYRSDPASDGENNSNTPPEATIDGDIGFASNPDLMYRVVAFQIHNPFGSPLDLGGQIVPQSELYNVQDPQFPRLDREDSYFYLKIGDKEFKLASLVEQVCLSTAGATAQHNSRLPAVGDGDAGSPIAPQPNRPIALSTEIYASVGGATPLTLEPITIPAGKTVVVYALSDAPKEILARMSQLNTNAGSAGAVLNETVVGSKKYTDFRNIIRQAIERNLGVSSADISGVYWIPEVDTSAGRAIIPTQTNYVPDGATTVELWRALRSGPDARSAVERLPNTYWDGVTTPAPRPGGPALTAAVPNDRRNDQLVDRFRVGVSTRPEGLNAKLPSIQNQIQGSDATDDGKLYMATTWAVFSRHGNPGGTPPPIGALPAYCVEPKFSTINSDEWNQSVAWSVPASPLNENSFSAFGAPPDEGFAESVAAWAFNMAATEITGNRIAEGPNQLGSPFPPATIFNDRPYEENYPEIALANNDMEETVVPAATPPKRTVLRPADLLLPLGIGPEEMPIDANGAPVTDLELRWTTLGEAMALSMGYQINPNPGPDPDVTDPLAPAGPDDQWPLDRGQLRLDRFAPFYDVASDGTFDPATDERMGLQIPLALNILDTFTINPVDPATSGWETLKRPTPGTLNINTISLMTMRSSLPLLSPPPNTDPTGQPAWWWNGANPGPHNQSADLAASVFAYRSKGEAYLRPMSYLPSTSPYPFSQRVFFNDEDASGAPVKPNSPETDFAGRSVTSGVPAVHEYPGFRSVGELLAVRYREGAGSEGWPSSMDYLAHDNALAEPGWAAPGGLYPTGASGRAGVDSILYPNPAGGAAPKIPSNIRNSYKEQLSIINGLLPSVSTRSDYFCVWFLVHGYQKSDCEGLGIDDPLVPSIARRFVMVVDRSKVTKKGDLPEVLLFKEVPVDPMPR